MKVRLLQDLLRVVAGSAWEAVAKPQVTTADETPGSPRALTAQWLGAALGADAHGASLLSFDRGSHSSGTTDRCRLTLQWDAAGRAAGLPESLFLKCTSSLKTRLITGVVGINAAEVQFYQLIRPQLKIEAPTAFHASHDPSSWRSCLLLDDIVRSRGATFCSPDTAVDVEQMRAMLRLLATAHARYWNESAFTGPLAWLRTPQAYQADLRNIGVERNGPVGVQRAAAVIPARLLSQRDLLIPALFRALEIGSQGSATLLHGDCHIGNWYRTQAGEPGLCDWQVVLKGCWALDVAYTIGSSLRIDDRRRWEADLLRGYLDELAAGGVPALDFDQAWLGYRQQFLYPLFAWLCTIGRARWQPQMQPDTISMAIIGRLSTAIDDHDSIGALLGTGSKRS